MDVTARRRIPAARSTTVSGEGFGPVKRQMRLPLGGLQVNGPFVATPQIEHNWTANERHTRKP
jgi:hypothetical protein